MRSIVYERYGPPEVLRLTELKKPVSADNEVLIRTSAVTVTAGDCRVRSLTMPAGFGLIGRLALGISGPRQPILGAELAGVIESVGKNVKKFKPGDEVFAFTGARLGCYTEFKCLPEDGAVVHKPSNFSFEEAAAISSGGTTALAFFRRAKIRNGEKVLVIGASGGVGTAAVQIAKHFGTEVTAVCSAAGADLVRSLGADHVIDYATQDFTKSGETYDIILDAAGSAPFARSKNSLKPGGRLLLVLSGLADVLMVPWVAATGSKRVFAGPAPWLPDDLHLLAKLAEAGEYRAVIDRLYPWEQIVEAHRYVDSGRKKGNVVVTLGQ